MSQRYFSSPTTIAYSGDVSPDEGILNSVACSTASAAAYSGWLYPQPHDGSGGSVTLGSLRDVDTQGATVGEVLAFDGWRWVPVESPPANISGSTIQGLANVSTATPSGGQALLWNPSTSKWTPSDLPAASVALAGLSDVSVPSPSTGQVLTWNGSTWSASTPLSPADMAPPGMLLPTTRAGDVSLRLLGQSTFKVAGIPGVVVAFDVSAASNVGTTFNLSTTPDGFFGGGTAYTTGLTRVGTPGTAGAQVRVQITEQTPLPLYLYDPTLENAAPGLVIAETAGLFRGLPSGSGEGYSLFWNSTYSRWDSAQGVRSVAPAGSAAGILVGGADGDLFLSLDLANASVNELADVDTATTAPTNGQVLKWSSSGSKWSPGTVIDVSASSIDVLADVDTATTAPTNGQALVWSSSAAKWLPATLSTYSLPTASSSVLGGVKVGSGLAISAGVASVDLSAISVDALSDVDTTTTAPSNGQALVWNAAGSKWLPATLSSYSLPTATSSVLGGVKIGSGLAIDGAGVASVSLGATSVDALSDVDTTTTAPSDGQALVWSASGSKWQPATLSTYTLPTASASVLGGVRIGSGLSITSGVASVNLGAISVDALSDVDTVTAAPTNGQALVWSSSGSKWLPATLSTYTLPTASASVLGGVKVGTGLAIDGAGVASVNLSAISVDALGDVDTATAAPTNGQVMTWNATSSKWVPSTASTYSLPTASSSVLGGVKVGSGLAISAGVASVDLSAISVDALSDVDTTTTAPSNGQAMTWSAAAAAWVPSTLAGAFRITTGTTASLASGASQTIELLAGAAGFLCSLQISGQSWVTIYNSSGAPTVDASRPQGTDPGRSAGVVAEMVASAAQTLGFSPPYAFVNDDTTRTEKLYAKIRNIASGSQSLTVTASSVAFAVSLVNAAAGSGGGTVTTSVGDPYYLYVSLLLSMNGTNNSTTFLDGSLLGQSVTANGDAKISTAQTKYGGAAGLFDGGGDYLVVSQSNSSFVFGTKDLTVETWIYITSSPGSYYTILDNLAIGGSGGRSDAFSLMLNSSRQLQIFSNAAFRTASASAVPLNQWTHVALTRVGSTWSYFINGALDSNTVTLSISLTSGGCTIGTISDGLGNASYTMNGYIDDLRITSGLARYVSSYTPPVSALPSSGSNTALLLHMNGSSGSSTFTDSSTLPQSVVAYGNAQLSSVQSKFGGASALFDGNGDYLVATTGATFAFGTKDFTVETWVYITSAPGTYYTLFDNQVAGGVGARTNAFVLLITSSRQLALLYSGAFATSSTSTVPLNQWVHVAVTRSGTTWRYFINGVLDATTNTGGVNLTAGGCIIGTTADDLGSTGTTLNGYLDEFRITKGSALYTSSFTPPTAAFADVVVDPYFQSVALLLHMNGANAATAFTDSSPGALTVTPSGDAKLSTTQAKFGSASAYFDGTGDYLTIPSSTIWTFGMGDWTVEFWIYLSSYGGSITGGMVFGTVSGSTSGFAIHVGQNQSAFRVTSNASGTWADDLTVNTSGGPALNTWTHMAVVRQGGNLTIYKDGASVGTRTGVSGYNYSNPSNLAIIGRFNDGTYLRDLSGYIDELRVSKLARYTAAFTPATAAFPDY